MPLKLETKIQEVGGKHSKTLMTSIPRPIAKALNLKKGDKLEMYLDEKDRLIIEKQKQ